MSKTMRIKMEDAEGGVFYWTVKWVEVCHVQLGKKPRKVKGWSFTDHDGYERFSEGNWINFVPYFHLIATNYGFTTNLS